MKQTIRTLFNKQNIRHTLWNTAFVLFVISIVQRLIRQVLFRYTYESWFGSEWLINYQAGYVRRGLIGEILFFFAKNFNINLFLTIKIFSLICFILVCIFFIRTFIKKGYSLYILPLCFFLGAHILGYAMLWHKRDHAMLLFLIAAFWSFKSIPNLTLRIIIINILIIIALQIHEVFVFLSLPLLLLLFFNSFIHKGIIQSILLSLLCLLPSVCAFLLTLKFHGNMETAQTIWDSWVSVAHVNPAQLTQYSHGAISAISWESSSTFKYHFAMNFFTKSKGISSLIFLLMTFPLVYYITSNALLVFRKKESSFSTQDKTILSSLLIFQFCCILPILLILSCDIARIFFYWVTSSFCIFLLIQKKILQRVFPVFYTRFVEFINTKLSIILPPTKITLALLMLCIGIPIIEFNAAEIIQTSMWGNILRLISF